jgi:hypothetical protein
MHVHGLCTGSWVAGFWLNSEYKVRGMMAARDNAHAPACKVELHTPLSVDRFTTILSLFEMLSGLEK